MKLSYINFSLFILLSVTNFGYSQINSSEADVEEIVTQPKRAFNYSQKIDTCLKTIEEKGDYILRGLEISSEIVSFNKDDKTFIEFNVQFNGSEKAEQICTYFTGFGTNMTSECTITECIFEDYESDEDDSTVFELDEDESEKEQEESDLEEDEFEKRK